MGTVALILGIVGGIFALLILGAFCIWLFFASMKNWN